MPIMMESKSLTEAPKEPVYNANIAPEKYKHAVVDSKKVPIDSMIVYMEGMVWKCDYYSQVLDQDQEISDFNPSQTSPYQQYQVLRNYELKLQGDISRSFDQAQNRATVTGTAITYPGLIPNKGDVIIADIGDGRAGRFTVTSTNQKTIFSNSVYEIDFELAGFMNATIEKEIDKRVVRTSYFDKDFLTYGQNPVLIPEDYKIQLDLKDKIHDTLGAWLGEFYNHEIRTIGVPYSPGTYVFDPFVTSLITRVFTVQDNPLIGNISMYNCDEFAMANYVDIWDSILEGEAYMLDMSFKRYQLVNTNNFEHNLMLRNIKFSKIDYTVLPSININSLNDPLDILKYSTGTPLTGLLLDKEKIVARQKELNIECPFYYDSLDYVVSENVYLMNDKPVTPIEQELRSYFKTGAVDIKVILRYVNNAKEMTPIQRFYLMPVCLLMMIFSIRSI